MKKANHNHSSNGAKKTTTPKAKKAVKKPAPAKKTAAAKKPVAKAKAKKAPKKHELGLLAKATNAVKAAVKKITPGGKTARPLANKYATKTTGKAPKKHANSFHQLFIEEIQELYSIENQLIAALPKMAKNADSHELKQAIKDHLKETQAQAKRLEKIFRLLDTKQSAHFSEAMKGIIKEGEILVSRHLKDKTKDAAIIAAAQKVEHYEIAAYGIARAHAKRLNLDEIAGLLDESLDEEADADKKLSKIADGTFFSTGVNQLAVDQSLAPV